ncbi:hypothetical protein [Ornithinimicrobium cavernae]|uniref:hypothetical protein n=1 Tax=Ornithinimicrobium cavernae TaxID=2666047 RepID=UPI000D686174|nr:hypothetical protein [Ornithinimicrobium cavernae]
MRNVHRRTIDASADAVGAHLDALGGPEDRWWPSRNWPPMILDRPLQVGADGGHGPIRYHVTGHEPGRRVRFAFHARTGLVGWHEFTVTPAGRQRCSVRHEVGARATGRMRVLVPLVVRSLHDAVLEDLLDNAERVATGRVRHPARWSLWVRVLHRLTVAGRRTSPRSQRTARVRREAVSSEGRS